MLKRVAISIFFFIACVIHLGHSLFPHVHHVEDHEHNGHHHHHEESEENGLSLFFSHFNHSSDNFSKGHDEEEVFFIKIASLKATPVVITGVGFERFFCEDASAATIFREPFVFISPHLLSLQFRGPPTLFI